MPGNRQQHKSPVLTEECSYCGSTVYIEVEKTTADEYNGTMVLDKACNGVSKDVSQEKRLVPHHKIREAITRLRDEYGFGIPDFSSNDKRVEKLIVNYNLIGALQERRE